MKKIDENKLREYQKMNRVQDFINSIEDSNIVDTKVLNFEKIKNALDFLRSLKEKNEFELLASEIATISAMKYLHEMEVYIRECIVSAHQKRDELAKQLKEARESSLKAFETIIKPNFQEIIKALEKVQKMPLPRTHKRDAFSTISDDMQKEIKVITDLIGTTYSR